MRRWGLWLVAAVVALAAACSDEDGASSSTATEREGTGPTTTATASVEQYASIVSKHSAEMLDAIDIAEECLGAYQFPCDAGPAITVSRVALQASTLALELGLADNDSSSNVLYIGAVPKELEDLVERTMAAAESAQLHGEAFNDQNCGAQPGDDVNPADSCVETAQFSSLANNELKAALLAWEP